MIKACFNSILESNETAKAINSYINSAFKEAKSATKSMNLLNMQMLEMKDGIREKDKFNDKINLFFEEFTLSDSFKIIGSLNGENNPYKHSSEIIRLIDKLESSSFKKNIYEKFLLESEENVYIDRYNESLSKTRRILSNVERLREKIDLNHSQLTELAKEAIDAKSKYTHNKFNSFIDKILKHDWIDYLPSKMSSLNKSYHSSNFNINLSIKQTTETVIQKKNQPTLESKKINSLKRYLSNRNRVTSDKIISYLDKEVLSESIVVNSESIKVNSNYEMRLFMSIKLLASKYSNERKKFKKVLANYSIESVPSIAVTHDICVCRPFTIRRLSV